MGEDTEPCCGEFTGKVIPWKKGVALCDCPCHQLCGAEQDGHTCTRERDHLGMHADRSDPSNVILWRAGLTVAPDPDPEFVETHADQFE